MEIAPPNPWTSLASEPPYIAEADQAILSPDYQRKYALRCDVLPHAWIGNPRGSRVILLQLNPGFAEADVDDERNIPAYRLIGRATITLDGQAGFWPLDPRLAATSGAQWWRPRLRPLIEALGASGEALVVAGLSVVEYFPYHSLSYKWPPRLPSQEFSFHLVREAAADGAVVLVMRQWESWRAAVPELIGYPKLFRNPNPRQAAVSPTNLGQDTFNAVVAALRLGLRPRPRPYDAIAAAPDETPGAVPASDEAGAHVEGMRLPGPAGGHSSPAPPYRAVAHWPGQAATGGPSEAPLGHSRSFPDVWVENAKKIGVMPKDGFEADLYLALVRSRGHLATTIDQVLDAAITRVGAARIAGPLLERVRGAEGLALTRFPDLLEPAALTLACAGVLSALDLCADALSRAAGDVPKAKGEFQDLGRWAKPERRAEGLKRFPACRDWADRLFASVELSRIREARDALIHRHAARQSGAQALVAFADGQGGYRSVDMWGPSTVAVPQAPGQPAKELGRVDDLVAQALAFGEREVLACRDALRRDGVLVQ